VIINVIMYGKLIRAKEELKVEYLDIFPYVKGEVAPGTVSKHYLSFRKLEQEGLYNEVFLQNIKKLSKEFAAWKKTRGDGNCYYRSVMTSFLTKLFHFSRPSEHLEIFIRKIRSLLNDQSCGYNSDAVSEVLVVFERIFNDSEGLEKKVLNFIEIQRLLQDKDFDYKIILLARVITKQTLLEKIKDKEYCGFLTDDELELVKNNVEVMGREAEGIELSLLPLGLGIEVTQINFFDCIIKNIYPEPDLTGGKLKVSILSKGQGHYDCLFSKQELEKECYSLKEKKYYFIKPS